MPQRPRLTFCPGLDADAARFGSSGSMAWENLPPSRHEIHRWLGGTRRAEKTLKWIYDALTEAKAVEEKSISCLWGGFFHRISGDILLYFEMLFSNCQYLYLGSKRDEFNRDVRLAWRRWPKSVVREACECHDSHPGSHRCTTCKTSSITVQNDALHVEVDTQQCFHLQTLEKL